MPPGVESLDFDANCREISGRSAGLLAGATAQGLAASGVFVGDDW